MPLFMRRIVPERVGHVLVLYVPLGEHLPYTAPMHHVTGRVSAYAGTLAAVMLLTLAGCRNSTPPSRAQSTALPAASERQGASSAAAPSPRSPRDAGRAACEQLHAAGPLEHTIATITRADSPEHEQWLTMLMTCSLHGYGEHHITSDALYLHIGALRPLLLAKLDDRSWQQQQRPGASLVRHARGLLSLWHHPDDSEHIEQWLAASKRFARRPEQPLTGPTATAAALSWSAAHFEREMADSGMQAPPPHSLSVSEAPGGERALADHSVHYANWGYAHQLVIVRDPGGTWSVQIVIETEHWHM